MLLDNLKDAKVITFRGLSTLPEAFLELGSTRKSSRTLENLTQYENFQLPSPITIDSRIKFIHPQVYDYDCSPLYEENVNVYSLIKAFSLTKREIKVYSHRDETGWKFPPNCPMVYNGRFSDRETQKFKLKWEWPQMIPWLSKIEGDGNKEDRENGYRECRGAVIRVRRLVGNIIIDLGMEDGFGHSDLLNSCI